MRSPHPEKELLSTTTDFGIEIPSSDGAIGHGDLPVQWCWKLYEKSTRAKQ